MMMRSYLNWDSCVLSNQLYMTTSSTSTPTLSSKSIIRSSAVFITTCRHDYIMHRILLLWFCTPVWGFFRFLILSSTEQTFLKMTIIWHSAWQEEMEIAHQYGPQQMMLFELRDWLGMGREHYFYHPVGCWFDVTHLLIYYIPTGADWEFTFMDRIRNIFGYHLRRGGWKREEEQIIVLGG